MLLCWVIVVFRMLIKTLIQILTEEGKMNTIFGEYWWLWIIAVVLLYWLLSKVEVVKNNDPAPGQDDLEIKLATRVRLFHPAKIRSILQAHQEGRIATITESGFCSNCNSNPFRSALPSETRPPNFCTGTFGGQDGCGYTFIQPGDPRLG